MKRKILIGCAISGAAVLTAGIGIGVACAVWHSKPQATDVITLDTDKPTLALINEEATITAVSSLGKTVSLSATIDGIPVDDINIFNPATGTIRYTDGDLECQTIVVTAEDGFAVSQSVSVGFGQIPPNPTPVPPNSLSLYAATLNPNSYNQGVATKIEGDVTEISFNTYDNPTLAISLKDYTNDDSLVWQYSTDNSSYSDITTSIGNTGIVPIWMGLGKMLLHASNTRDTYTFEDFYIQASIDDPKLIPEPILVHFHNAPEIETSGGIITGDETHITDFDTHNSLVKYDTIYIPDTITSIDSGVFSDCFTGSGNCQTIQNVIFADRFGKVCDVGEDAFSSQTDLVLKGNIYIGFGKYVCDTGDVYAPAFFFSTHAIDSSTSDLSIEMGDVTVNGDCIISAVGGTIVADSIAPACFFSTCYLDSDSDSDSDLSIKIGDVIINGDCSVSSKTDVLWNPTCLFSVYTKCSSASSSSIQMSNVTTNGKCSCSGVVVLFFSDYSTDSTSTTSISITMGDVIINGNYDAISINHGDDGYILFFSALARRSVGDSDVLIDIGDVAINGDCSFTTSYFSLIFSVVGESANGSYSLILGNVMINGNFSFGKYVLESFFSSVEFGNSNDYSTLSIAIGDVTINGYNNNADTAVQFVFFSASYQSAENTTVSIISVSIKIDDVTINGNYNMSSYGVGCIAFFSSFFACKNSKPDDLTVSIDIGDVTINGNCNMSCTAPCSIAFFSSFSQCKDSNLGDYTVSIDIGDVTIADNCHLDADGISTFFSSYSSSNGSTSITMGDVIIDGVCSSDGEDVFFFSAYSENESALIDMGNVIINGECSCAGYFSLFFSAFSASDDSTSIKMDNVTINGKCSCGSNTGYSFFFSAGDLKSSNCSITMRDIKFDSNAVITIMGLSKVFFYASDDGASSITSFTIDSAVFKTNNAGANDPVNLNLSGTTITWPTWQSV